MSLSSKGLYTPDVSRSFAKLVPVDGNGAAAHVAYHMSEASLLYPITPSTAMGEQYDKWAASGKKNVFGHVPVCRVLQSEAGAAGALHGAASVGTFCTTFTASQGLLLMIPNMLKTAGELWPAVFHVAARAVSTQALSIQGDHADVMCVKNTGFAMLSSSTVQECQDLAAIAHMSTVDAQIPFVHFFEGFRLSHEIDSIVQLTPEEMKQLMPFEKLNQIRNRSLNPAHPMALGHSQGADAYFQTVELYNPFYDKLPEIVEANMKKFADLTGREYHLFDYYGHPQAEDVIVMMGAGSTSVRECIDLMKGEKVGLIIPRLYRPWSSKRFLEILPKTVKRVSIMDRSKDPAAPAEPLFMDVAYTLKQAGHPAKCYGGRYGLASKDFTPLHAKAIYDNMRSSQPKEHFTVGINDDVTFLSLPKAELPGFGEDSKVSQSIFWGLGGDGTIGANKAAIKACIDERGIYAQGYFAYSADKSNSLTRSYLRMSPNPIHSQYTITHADFVGCTLPSYVTQYPMAENLKDGGVFFLNFPSSDISYLDKFLPADFKRKLAKKHAKLYVIDASSLALECGLNGKISTIVQACYYHLTQVLGKNWLPITLKWIEKEFGRLGDDVVNKNKKAASMASERLKLIPIPDYWLTAEDEPGQFISKSEISFMKKPTHEIPKYKTEVLDKVFTTKGGSLPVSAFKDSLGGISPVASTKWLKKGLSQSAPSWNSTTCIQCNACSAVCPQSVIRPFLITEEEIKSAPKQIQRDLVTIKAKGKELKGLQYRIQCSPYDCINCKLCVDICPTKSLTMKQTIGNDEALQYAKEQNDLFIYLDDVIPNRGHLIKDKYTVRGSQFQKPLIEFPGSCQGCNETLVAKIATQLFGKRMLIANASGCSSVWGGSFSKIPFTTDENGRGPAWARSLFEDNAEFGFGMTIGLELRRKQLHEDLTPIINDKIFMMKLPKELSNALNEWYNDWMDGEKTLQLEPILLEQLNNNRHIKRLDVLQDKRDLWVKPSNWIFGGDGWAYDIGFGGLDHVMASGKNFNVLVFDNEIYANTGGQQSKATQLGAIAEFAANGKDTPKKDLGFMMMGYGNVYVASCALGTQNDLKHLIKCLKEAESFDGPSLVLVYCNCIMHHIKGAIGAASFKAHQLAVESGYWPIYSYDPRREKEGKNPLEFLSKKPDLEKLDKFLDMEVRYNRLKKNNPKLAKELRNKLHKDVLKNYKKYLTFSKVFEP
ncbi:pyruvate:ferredoxin (flavodoxin) oxidoreductase [Histomonas meleagridis]|uniref:pyruvate:ferredoxin (flavodoxin) oxidoreductase n=1 Tax=Histomonas meleagridis TaxID=135588 RepID=UPI00355A8DCE|nr:pyruvate:ferredoxin (flavodoxin) oxidoreductase [Histomonas meleagridis]KAH0806155.1 pyruvate:ferredoxin (flavodoxin) oxidoreductase [Histomonas meleagridis]